MTKQLIHIHGGNSWRSYDDYLAYLNEKVVDPNIIKNIRWRQRYLESLGEDWQIISPQMPSPQNVKYIEWAIWFEKYIPFLQDGVVLVGHSLGVVFLAKYLSENTLPVKVSQLHLVAGIYGDTVKEKTFDFSDDLSSIERQCESIYIYHSQDDMVVPYEHAGMYAKALPKAKLITFTDRGHFLQSEFPELMENILQND